MAEPSRVCLTLAAGGTTSPPTSSRIFHSLPVSVDAAAGVPAVPEDLAAEVTVHLAGLLRLPPSPQLAAAVCGEVASPPSIKTSRWARSPPTSARQPVFPQGVVPCLKAHSWSLH